MKLLPFLFVASVGLASTHLTLAQGRGKDKDKKEYKYEKDKKDKDKDHYKEGDGDQDRYERRGQNAATGILGRVILAPAGSSGPRQLAGVPRGHYPPPGECRIWYPNRPPGQQPPPISCERLRGVRLEPGAFILHGDRAYDTAYDWRGEERRHPGSVARVIIDILFPAR